jgi:hypothetical protein
VRAGRCSQRKGCTHCGRAVDPWGRCRRRRCPGYRDLWAGDWRKVLRFGLVYLEHVALITVTAPGGDLGLPFDTTKCTHEPGERCSGRKGCVVVKAAADRWHQDVEHRFARLHRAAMARVARRVGRGAFVGAKTWELQRRGVAHLHLVVPCGTPRERARVDAYVEALKAIAPRYMFGFCDVRRRFEGGWKRTAWGREDASGGSRAAGYLAKYVGKATSENLDVKRPVFVGRFLTIRTGITMRALRWRRWIHCLWRFTAGMDELPALVHLLKAFPNLEYLGLIPQPRAP